MLQFNATAMHAQHTANAWQQQNGDVYTCLQRQLACRAQHQRLQRAAATIIPTTTTTTIASGGSSASSGGGDVLSLPKYA
jgi:hypothetical protein